MIDQIGIAMTGVTAIFLSQCKDERLRRYACLFGMVGQPFWFYAAISAEQWGIVALNCLYTLAWAKGVKAHWWAQWTASLNLNGPRRRPKAWEKA